MPDGMKQEGAFLTIGELSAELGVPHHILRYWESRFPMLRPLQRAGNRRYYRPEDVALVRRIHRLLTVEGYTVRGAQQALSGKGEAPDDLPASDAPDELSDNHREALPPTTTDEASGVAPPEPEPARSGEADRLIERLMHLREKLLLLGAQS